MVKEWFYSQYGADRTGPVSAPELKQLAALGEIKPGDLVWKEGMPNPVRASRVKGLLDKTRAAEKDPSSNPDGIEASKPKPATLAARGKGSPDSSSVQPMTLQSEANLGTDLQLAQATVHLTCPHCGKEVYLDRSLSGQIVACPVYQEELQIPVLAPSVTPVAAAVTAAATNRRIASATNRRIALCVALPLAVVFVPLYGMIVLDSLLRSGSEQEPQQAAIQRGISDPQNNGLAERQANEEKVRQLRVAEILDRYRNGGRDERVHAIKELKELGPSAKEAVPVLMEALSHPYLAEDAIIALQHLGPTASLAISALVNTWMNNNDLSERISTALHRINENEATQFDSLVTIERKIRVNEARERTMKAELRAQETIGLTPMKADQFYGELLATAEETLRLRRELIRILEHFSPVSTR
jgi:hypothetical protein